MPRYYSKRRSRRRYNRRRRYPRRYRRKTYRSGPLVDYKLYSRLYKNILKQQETFLNYTQYPATVAWHNLSNHIVGQNIFEGTTQGEYIGNQLYVKGVSVLAEINNNSQDTGCIFRCMCVLDKYETATDLRNRFFEPTTDSNNGTNFVTAQASTPAFMKFRLNKNRFTVLGVKTVHVGRTNTPNVGQIKSPDHCYRWWFPINSKLRKSSDRTEGVWPVYRIIWWAERDQALEGPGINSDGSPFLGLTIWDRYKDI